MKSFQLIWAFLFFTVLFSCSLAQAQISRIQVEPRAVFLPSGYDDNDNVQVVIDGFFTDSCYQYVSSHAVVDPVSHVISITVIADHNDEDLCLNVIVPYTDVLDLGVLPSGLYEVHTTANKGLIRKGTLKIASAKSKQVDSRRYAPVDSVSAEQVSADGDLTIKLNGNFTAACAKIKRVKIDFEENIIEILPLVRNRWFMSCEPGLIPFEKELHFNDLYEGRYLVHVRASEGRAFNQVVAIIRSE